MSKREFQTEVNQLLHLIVHSLYSHPEIFLRELISNASDALDKLRHLTLVDESFKTFPFTPRIDLELDEEKQTLTIADTGIGMNEEELVSNLGTIARSGTKNFLAQLSGDAKKDSNLIGQFGVGFYSVFMVADRAEVVSRKAGEEKAWRWVSDGKTGFEIEPAEREVAGTTVIRTVDGSAAKARRATLSGSFWAGTLPSRNSSASTRFISSFSGSAPGRTAASTTCPSG